MDIQWNDTDRHTPPGLLVTVNNHKMHVFKKGEGADILVLMSGGGTCCPTVDFKPLWSLLIDKYTVAVIEKAGYGWSETANCSRDIDTILYETRTALTLAGLSPPYILMPHSLTGLEALAWAVQFPHEIRAIIGLDAAIPACYDQMSPAKATGLTLLYRILSIGARIGLLRPIAKTAEKQIRACGHYSEKEISIYREMFIYKSFTKNMAEEVSHCRSNVKKVKALGIPASTPYLSFISDGKEVGLSNWRQILIQFVSEMSNGKYVKLDCGHYIHYFEPERIALETEKFICSLQKSERLN